MSSGITVGELIKFLQSFPETHEVMFGNAGFTFYRVKERGGIAQIEFNEWVENGKVVYPAGPPT